MSLDPALNVHPTTPLASTIIKNGTDRSRGRRSNQPRLRNKGNNPQENTVNSATIAPSIEGVASNRLSAHGSKELIPPNVMTSRSQSSNAPSLKKPCFDWRAGKCSRGYKCRYNHDEIPLFQNNLNGRNTSVAGPSAPRAQVDISGANSREQEVTIKARVEEQAARRRKDEERKAAQKAAQERQHQAKKEAAQFREAKRLEAEQEATRKREAQARERIARLALVAEQEALRNEREATVTTQHVVLGSTLITCGAGLDIRGVVSGFDSCTLTIRNLPLDTKPAEVIELFTQQGMSWDNIHLLSIKPGSLAGGYLEAKVIISADQGSAIAVGLDGIEFRNERLQFEVGENTSMNAMGESSPRQADILTIFWPTPSLTMIATYFSMDDARTKAQILNRKVVDGRRIKAEMNQPPTGPALRFYNPASVKLMGLPMGTSVETVAEWAGTAAVRIIKSNTYDLQELLKHLRQHLESLANSDVQAFDTVHDREIDGTTTVKVRFGSWDEANDARTSLEGTRLRLDYPYFRFSLPQPLHFVSVIPDQQYNSQKRLWDSLADKQDKSARIYISHVADRSIVRIRLSGDDKKAVGALKVRVETLVAGEKLDATFWHRSFLWSKGKEFLAKVYLETEAYVRGDIKTHALKIYGEGEAKERARAMIEDEVARLAQQEWTVILKRQSVGFFVRKGLAILQEELGEDAVTLDLASTPCRLTIRGGEGARHALGTLMDQALNDLATTQRSDAQGNDICPVCYEPASSPFVLGCKHVYCTACFRHYLTSASESRIFPLVCMGEEANCKMPIAIPAIQRFLISQQYEDLVNASFLSYLDHHPQDFRYCTTPDCTQIYRANTKAMLKCPSCFAEVCSSCHEEAHEGMACDERRNRKVQEEEQLNDNWATNHGVKRCPSCRVYIEKTEGCNHMACRCGVHICWICMRIFPSDAIYGHLREVHGGFFDGDRLNLDHQFAIQLQHQERNNVPAVNRPLPPIAAAPQPDRILAAIAVRQPIPAMGVERNEEMIQAEYHQILQRRQQEARQRVIEGERREANARREAAARRQLELEHQRQREEYQRMFNERQARVLRRAEEQRRQDNRWGCIVM